MKVLLTPRAIDDLAAIGEYIGADDADRARTFVAELEAACRELADFPRRFRPADQFGVGIRCRTYGKYLILYEVLESVVRVTAVVHGARDLKLPFGGTTPRDDD